MKVDLRSTVFEGEHRRGPNKANMSQTKRPRTGDVSVEGKKFKIVEESFAEEDEDEMGDVKYYVKSRKYINILYRSLGLARIHTGDFDEHPWITLSLEMGNECIHHPEIEQEEDAHLIPSVFNTLVKNRHGYLMVPENDPRPAIAVQLWSSSKENRTDRNVNLPPKEIVPPPTSSQQPMDGVVTPPTPPRQSRNVVPPVDNTSPRHSKGRTSRTKSTDSIIAHFDKTSDSVTFPAEIETAGTSNDNTTSQPDETEDEQEEMQITGDDLKLKKKRLDHLESKLPDFEISVDHLLGQSRNLEMMKNVAESTGQDTTDIEKQMTQIQDEMNRVIDEKDQVDNEIKQLKQEILNVQNTNF